MPRLIWLLGCAAALVACDHPDPKIEQAGEKAEEKAEQAAEQRGANPVAREVQGRQAQERAEQAVEVGVDPKKLERKSPVPEIREEPEGR